MGNRHSHQSSSDNSNSTHVCDTPPFEITTTQPIVGNIQFHELNLIISGACTAISTVMLLVLMARHAFNFSKPQEQANILRICAFIPIYGIGSLIEICAPAVYIYLQPWLNTATAVALANFFILVCRLLTSESDDRRDVFLAPMRLMRAKGTKGAVRAANGYRRTWIMIFQYPVVSVLVAIFTDITQAAGVYCFSSSHAYWASLWLEIVDKASTAIAVISVLRTYQQLKEELRPHRALSKLFAFKALIGLQFLQGIIYMILTRINPSPLEPTATLSYTDMEVGIPLLLVSLELVIFSVFFHFAYSVTPYRLTSYRPKHLSIESGVDETHAASETGGSYRGGFLGFRAWAAVFDPRELIAAIAFTLKMQSEARKSDMKWDAASAPLNSYDSPSAPLSSPPLSHGYGADGRVSPAPQQYHETSYDPYRQNAAYPTHNQGY
ncbi:organic solute transporter Ostalpha-domain-containing protein [Pestalotiopsis sp. NC0098]|nr:organic solute transporter Ostalpha-domain-containing protein [Pestalotiopsis sp. NC0098]